MVFHTNTINDKLKRFFKTNFEKLMSKNYKKIQILSFKNSDVPHQRNKW